MQFHLNGFRPGDPAVAPTLDPAGSNCGEVDILIIGCGPAGLTLAAQLSAFPEINLRIVERKSGPLEVGQADGIACRSMEMFEAFGFAHKVLREAYWVNEVSFWRPRPGARELIRADRIRDVEEGLSEMPHVILNQARIHDHYLDIMRHAPRRLVPDYDTELTGLARDGDHVVATLARDGATETLRAKYVVGCDGARSAVRRSMGYALEGEAKRQLWGVMDVLAITDFPDIRLKAAIQSADQGSVLIIPREGGYMVRMYIEMDELQGDERAADRNLTKEEVIAKANAIMAPYRLDVKEVSWWSAYEIGQRVCQRFHDCDDDPRIFIAGDACHTHSPKAGQGMNVSMADTFNLGWKLAAVLRGQAGRHLLRTYSAERQAKAQELIDFDADMARLFSERPRNAAEAEQFQHYFKKHGRYTAGVETTYEPSMLVSAGAHQALAGGFTVGKRFHSAPVIRLADAKRVELGHMFRADGRWRLLAFAPARESLSVMGGLCDALVPIIATYTPPGGDPDAVIDLRAVFQQNHREMDLSRLPDGLTPTKGRFGLTDYEKVFCADTGEGPDIFDLRGIDRKAGALLIVRPDQFVADVLPLSAPKEVAGFFAGFMEVASS